MLSPSMRGRFSTVLTGCLPHSARQKRRPSKDSTVVIKVRLRSKGSRLGGFVFMSTRDEGESSLISKAAKMIGCGGLSMRTETVRGLALIHRKANQRLEASGFSKRSQRL